MSEHPHSLTTHDIIESMDAQIQEQAERIAVLEAAYDKCKADSDEIATRNAELEAQILGLRPTQIEFQQAKRIAALESELTDYRQTYEDVLSERCYSDERHCTCVPSLRKRIAALEAALRAIVDRSKSGGRIGAVCVTPSTLGLIAELALAKGGGV